MFYTTGCATILSLIVYGAVGFTLPASSISSPELVSQMLGTLESMFHFNLLLLLPPVIVLLGAFLRKPTVPVMLFASVLSIIMGCVFQASRLRRPPPPFTADSTSAWCRESIPPL